MTIFRKPTLFQHVTTIYFICNDVIYKYYLMNFSIDISMDRAIRITCPMQKVLVCVSSTAMNTVIYHPNGRIFQNNSRVDLVAFDGAHQNNLLRYAKFWQKGISFMAKDVPVVYLVDEAGLRSSVDHFIHIKKDYALDVFNRYETIARFFSFFTTSFYLTFV